MTQAEMWKVCEQAALMLDTASYDWQRLLEIEQTLSPLATELAGTTAAWSAGSPGRRAPRRPESELQLLRSCLSWVRQHAYDALETELRRQLDMALRCAMAELDRLEQLQLRPARA